MMVVAAGLTVSLKAPYLTFSPSLPWIHPDDWQANGRSLISISFRFRYLSLLTDSLSRPSLDLRAKEDEGDSVFYSIAPYPCSRRHQHQEVGMSLPGNCNKVPTTE